MRLLPARDDLYAWQSPKFDQAVYNAIVSSAWTLQAHAINHGLSDANADVYPNYTLFDMPPVELYGANLPRLQAIKGGRPRERDGSGGFQL